MAQTWKMDKSHAKLGFTVTHLMISEVDGNFKDFDVTITSSKDDFSDAVFELTVQMASVNTDNQRRDDHLRTPDFFEVEKYPTMTFKSTSVKKTSGNKYALAGNLTMHGVTKPVTMDMTLMGTKPHPRTQKPIAAFKVTGTLNRLDFGVGSTTTTTVGSDIEIRAVGEFVKE
jgi:polyisoprenoid-binding protein YceI